MSEKLTHNEEKEKTPLEASYEGHKDNREQAKIDERLHNDPERLKSIHEKVESASKPKESFPTNDTSEQVRHSHIFINRELKDISFNRTMTRVRKKLSYPDKIFSKIIHNQAIDKVSTVAASTVVRPKSTLIAGITAFISSLTLLFVVRKYGYEYNYLFVLLVFLAGYILGLFIEFLLYGLHRRKHGK